MADTLFYGGDIYTGNERDDIEDALLVRDGKVYYTGSYEDALRLTDDSTEQIDLEGRDIIPGFCDGSAHLLRATGQGNAAHRTISGWGFGRYDEFGITTALDNTDYGSRSLSYFSRHSAQRDTGVRVVSALPCSIDDPGDENIAGLIRRAGLRTGLGNGTYILGPVTMRENKYCSPSLAAAELIDCVRHFGESGFSLMLSLQRSSTLTLFLHELSDAYRSAGMPSVTLRTDFPPSADDTDMILSLHIIPLVCPSVIRESNAETRARYLEHIYRMYSCYGRVGVYYSHTDGALSYPLWELISLGSMLSSYDFSLPSVIRMATLDTARSFGIHRLTGSLEWGKSADFLILSGSLHDTAMAQRAWRVTHTYFRGRLVYRECENETDIIREPDLSVAK